MPWALPPETANPTTSANNNLSALEVNLSRVPESPRLLEPGLRIRSPDEECDGGTGVGAVGPRPRERRRENQGGLGVTKSGLLPSLCLVMQGDPGAATSLSGTSTFSHLKITAVEMDGSKIPSNPQIQ